MGLLKPRMSKGVVGFLLAALILTSHSFAGERMEVADVIAALKKAESPSADEVDKKWKTKVFPNFSIENGVLMYQPANAPKYKVAWVEVTSIAGKEGPDSISSVNPIVVPLGVIGLTPLFPSTQAGVIGQDENGILWYQLQGMDSPAVLNAAALNGPNADALKALMAQGGITYTINPDGTVTFNHPSIRGPNGSMGTIIIGLPNGQGQGAGGGGPIVLQPFPSGPSTGGTGYQYGNPNFQYSGPGLSYGFQFGPGMGYGVFPDGSLVPSGNWGFSTTGLGGASITIVDNAAKVMDPAKFAGGPHHEFEVMGLKYRIQKIEDPRWFHRDDRVILRQGAHGEWILIDPVEHRFLMAMIQQDAEKYKETIKKLKDTGTDKWDEESYKEAWEHGRLHKDTTWEQFMSTSSGTRITSFGSVNPNYFNGGLIIAGGAGVGGGNQGQTVPFLYNSPGMYGPGQTGGMVITGMYPNGGGSYTNNDVNAFLQAFMAQNPNAKLEDIQAALNAKFGPGAVIITANPNGGYQFRMGPSGATGPGAMVFNFGGSAGGLGGMGGLYFGPSASSGINIKALADATIAAMMGGSSSSSSSSGSSSAPSSPSTPSAPGTTSATASFTAKASSIPSGLGYAIKVPVLQSNGVYKYEYRDLQPSEYSIVDGKLLINSGVIDELKKKYPNVDFSVLTTAPGSSSSSGSAATTEIQAMLAKVLQLSGGKPGYYYIGSDFVEVRADGSAVLKNPLVDPIQVQSIEGASKDIVDLLGSKK